MIIISSTSKNSGIAVSRLCEALNIPRASYYRKAKNSCASASNAHTMPKNSLTKQERQSILDLLHSDLFVDKTPYEIYYSLLDQGRYICSPRTIYRLLDENDENNDRRIQRNHRDAVKPELMAIQPNEVWSWDITKLLSTHRLVYYHLYVIIDIFSRYVVGWLVAEKESQALAQKLIQKTTLKYSIPPGQLTLHADNGPSMKAGSVAQLLEYLGIAKTHNRPYTSNDNPFSESQFKTLKYHSLFPNRFENLNEAERFCQRFFNWYNREHYHSGIVWLTPESVHFGQADEILAKRHETLKNAFERDPVRFNRQLPKLKKLHKAVYINPPQNSEIVTLQEEESMA